MELIEKVAETQRQSYITRQEALQEKMLKKEKRAGKTRREIEVEQAKRDAELAVDQKEEEENKLPITPIKYRIGEEYDEHVAKIRKMDFQYE